MATTRPSPADAKTEKRDFRQEVTDSIIRMLEQGVAPWQKPWDASALHTPLNPTTGKPYRGGNALHLLAVGIKRGYSDPRWTTYKQAAENGWQVRKGEKGTQIEFWDFSRTGPSDRGKPNDTVAGTEEDEKSVGAKVGSQRPLHRVYTVFNAQQIDGIPAYAPKEHTPFEVAEAGESILRNSGVAIHHDQRDRAFYNRRSDAIHLPPKQAFKDAAGYYGTALHELAHATGAPNRLNRPTLNESYRFGDLNYAKEELRAEIASLFIAAERGIPHDPSSHAAYVGSWITALRDDKHEIFRAAQDASKAADFVLSLERDQALAEAVEVEAPDRGEQVSKSTELVAAAEEPIRREIADVQMDRDAASDREGDANYAVAAETGAVRESSQQTARFNRDNGTVDVHEKQAGIDHHVPAANAAKEAPGRDHLAKSFDDARKAASEAMGETARTTTALTASGTYRGNIIAETDHHVLQRISGQTAVAHMKHALTPLPQVGESVVIAYSNLKGSVSEFRERSRQQQLSR
jgi:antirestriction protein ArdC